MQIWNNRILASLIAVVLLIPFVFIHVFFLPRGEGWSSESAISWGQPVEGVRCGISTPKGRYNVGRDIEVLVTLKNVSSNPLRVVRYNEKKNGHRAHLNWRSSFLKKEGPFICQCISLPFYGKKDETVVLQPGERYEFRMTYSLVERHVDYPRVSASYFIAPYRYNNLTGKSTPEWVEEVAKESPLWNGSVTSGSIRLDIRR